MDMLKKLFIVDSTVIGLLKDILKIAGRPRKDGKNKSGSKAHVMPKGYTYLIHNLDERTYNSVTKIWDIASYLWGLLLR